MDDRVLRMFVEGNPAPAGSKSGFGRLTETRPPAALLTLIAASRDAAHIGAYIDNWVRKVRIAVTMAPSSKFQKPWQTLVARRARADGWRPFERGVAVMMAMQFVIERPKQHHVASDRSRPVKPAFAQMRPVSAPDELKLGRAVEDALLGLAYADDAQVVCHCIESHYGPRPGVDVMVCAVNQFSISRLVESYLANREALRGH